MTDERRDELVEQCRKLMFVRLTDEHIEAAQSTRGGWSESQLKLIGVEWPPAKGWRRAAAGRRLSGSLVAAFITLRDAHL